jgi:competence protein ComGC
MEILIVLLALSIAIALGVYIVTKGFNKFEDKNDNGLPDVVEEKVEAVKKVVAGVKKQVTKAQSQSKTKSNHNKKPAAKKIVHSTPVEKKPVGTQPVKRNKIEKL